MQTYEIDFMEYQEIIFGTGIKRTGYTEAKSEEDAINNFLNQARSTGRLVVVGATRHIPNKQKATQ
jgi:uncharacterized protein YggL (DUF469 family)